ncbi:MAG: PDZ domain-containing protein [Planctomycetota bacterium]|nr:PDZ domain-containing protein [Planctomycetota bacterium]
MNGLARAASRFACAIALCFASSASVAIAPAPAPAPSAAPPTAPPTSRTPAAPEVPGRIAIDVALRERDFKKADELISKRLAGGDRDPILLYNHACVLAQLGRLEDAEKQLLESVKAGFGEFELMEGDADLDPIREGRAYTAIMEARERLSEKAAKGGPSRPARRTAPDPLARWKSEHGERYRYEVDSERGLAYATSLDESSHKRMRDMLERLERHLLDAYFEKPPQDPALIAIVRAEDASRYLDRPEIRGMYLHRERRLVSRDTGQSLTHEFVHLLHFADMERRNQRHPIWIQEGLASLYEDYTINGDGSVEFHPNIRFNIARKQVVSRTARDWKELFAMSGERFMQDAERHYPQVRSIFEFFARERKLEAFYRALIETSRDDPSGVRAVERAFGEPVSKVEARWRIWMTKRGEIDDRVSKGDASLGVTTDDAGDGARIRSFVVGSAARAAGLRVGDVIFSVAGSPVRNRDELLLAVARLNLGEAVEVRYRRDGGDLSTMVTPRPLGR